MKRRLSDILVWVGLFFSAMLGALELALFRGFTLSETVKAALGATLGAVIFTIVGVLLHKV